MVRHTGEDFVNEEGVAVASVLSLQSACVNGSELDAPEVDGFATDCDASLGKQILDIPMTEIESIIEPNGVRDNIGRESMAFISIHVPILAISGR